MFTANAMMTAQESLIELILGFKSLQWHFWLMMRWCYGIRKERKMIKQEDEEDWRQIWNSSIRHSRSSEMSGEGVIHCVSENTRQKLTSSLINFRWMDVLHCWWLQVWLFFPLIFFNYMSMSHFSFSFQVLQFGGRWQSWSGFEILKESCAPYNYLCK